MKFVPVENVPLRGCPQHNLQHFIDEFVNAFANTVKVEFTEKDYKNVESCYSSLWGAVKKSGHKIAVMKRGNDIFLTKI